jgi:hypothetical protein
MKTIKSLLIILGIILASCEGIVDGINDNPNKITVEDVEAELFLTGALLANSVAQGGHLNRISGMYSGHLIGFTSLYSNIYGYSISTAESTGTWSRYYIGIVPNVRHIIELVPQDKLLVGISKVLEAHAIGTAATIFGDVPYSEINDPSISDAKFDSQSAVFTSLIALLGDAIIDLNGATSRTLPADIYYDGDAAKWSEAAATLQARYFLQMKMYPQALTAATVGISTNANNMQFIPRGDAAISEGDKNLFWTILAGSRGGDIGTGNSYLIQLLETGGTADRNNAKTDEAARLGYYTIDADDAGANQGIIEQFEPQNLVSYAENQLIMAEAEARANGVSANALGHLNAWRQVMDAGGHVNGNFQGDSRLYTDYVAADFTPTTGMENADGIAADRAFLREVIEERYVTGLQNYMAFNDIRRLAASDSDLMVPFPLNTGTATEQPQRLPYSDDELNTNVNAPNPVPSIFTTTEVNQ